MAKLRKRKRLLIKEIIFTIIVVGVILAGWKIPILGYIVPITMLTGFIISMINGRYHCGHVCPRGLFLNLSLHKLSRNKKIPALLKNMKFRVGVLAVMMAFLAYRILTNFTSFTHIGKVFWLMCAVTTVVGITVGLFFKPRTWCSFCPMGTMQNLIGTRKKSVKIDTDLCVDCKVCEKKCPLDISLLNYKDSSAGLKDKDCLKCMVCVESCPKNAIDYKGKRA